MGNYQGLTHLIRLTKQAMCGKVRKKIVIIVRSVLNISTVNIVNIGWIIIMLAIQ